ncbi:GNAT family N-acetyltransferase [Kineosporia sp. J2-2]|uniref:GNAT family N-acetyltransferase n=1 Tax=Kineosporia corallincola TaxID=2835133 RepID=A0ABS5TMK7_9ACTN|nr:GNAT family N-acetyltransferase [Kineosporia corallincola]MBT0772336.1 GNAT family N-acetyltransferase [Kineosporia corallincola]
MISLAAEGFGRAMVELCRHAPGGQVHRFGHATLVTTGAPTASLNYVMALGPAPRTADVARAAAVLEASQLPWGLEFRTDPGPEIMALAADFGITELSRPGFMTAPAQRLELRDEAPATGPGSPGLPGLRIEAAGPDRYEEYTDVLTRGFEAPAGTFGTAMGGTVLALPGLTGYLALDEGRAVGTGLGLTSPDGVLSVFNVAVVPAARGRGIGRALTQAALRDGLRRGARVVGLQGSEMGRPLYESLGLRETERWFTLGRPGR